MSTQHCIQCRIQGRVQGVWFRGSTQSQAIRLNLGGYARNLPDGSVEVLACGDAKQLEILRQWLQHGPSSARVEQLDCNLIELNTAPGQYRKNFTIG